MLKSTLLRTLVATVALAAIPGTAAAKYEQRFEAAPPPAPVWTTNVDGLDVDPWGMRGETRTSCGCVLPGQSTPATKATPRRHVRTSAILDPADPWGPQDY